MGYQREKTSNKYLDRFITSGVKEHFGLILPPAQIQVLKSMLTHDYVLFRHGRGCGATFLLAVLAVILRKVNPDVNMVVTAPTSRQAEFINSEIEQKFKTEDKFPIVNIKQALSGKYDVVLLDEITKLPKESIESLITHIKKETISKIVAVCGGYRLYFPIAALESTLYSGSSDPDNNRDVITKCYEDMPLNFSGPGNLDEARKLLIYPEEFDMEYKGHFI